MTFTQGTRKAIIRQITGGDRFDDLYPFECRMMDEDKPIIGRPASRHCTKASAVDCAEKWVGRIGC